MEGVRKVIAITGASGNMGIKVVRKLMESDSVFLKILFLDTAKDRKIAKKWCKEYAGRIETLFGNVGERVDCEKLVFNSDYVINMAAVIPPRADHNHHGSEEANKTGAINIVKAVENSAKTKLIHVSSVAIYGDRNYKHPWGRVGDPLLPSVYDVYAMSKLVGERAVLDSSIKEWMILRQTGILYDKLLFNNISDGLMFHTCFNVPIEWVTDEDSATLIKNIIEKDIKQEIEDSWNKVYNIGGGKEYRTTGYETFNLGFAMIGGNAEKFMKPEWQATRNFHCMWFEDSKVLGEKFGFQTKTFADFWNEVLERNKYFALAKIIPSGIIRKIIFERLLKNENSPYEWVRRGLKGRIIAAFGSSDEYEKLKKGWAEFPLLERDGVECFGFDYRKAIDEGKIEENGYRLNHGFDENKPITELGIDDVKEAAKFRGGECLSADMKKGDLYTKLKWKCAEGHEFYATPYAVLFAGHWCEKCLDLYSWNFDALAKNNPFFAQIWYDSHDVNENYVYYFDDSGNALIKKGV